MSVLTNSLMRGLALIIVLVFCLAASSSGQVQWTPDGVAICTTSGDQGSPQIVGDGTGGAILVWEDKRSGDYDIYAQRVNGAGKILWAVDGVAICTAADYQGSPQIVGDGAGGAIMVWKDNRSGSSDIYAQRVDGAGKVLWAKNGVAICTAASYQNSPQIAGDGAGGAILVWGDQRSGSDIYAQRVDRDGNVQWAPNGVAICKAANSQFSPRIVGDGAGGAILVWQDERSSSWTWDIYAQRVDGAGNVLWAADGVAICMAAYYQNSPQIAGDGAGGAILVWGDQRSGSDIYAQRVDGDGNILWAADGVAICTASDYQDTPQIAGDGAGGAILAWEDYRSGSYYDIYAQRVDGDGNALWAANGLAICTASFGQLSPQIAGAGAGGSILVWQDNRSGSYSDIYAQRVNGDGNALWAANGVAICTADFNQEFPQIAGAGTGGAILVWNDYRFGSSYDIYTQRVIYAIGLFQPEGGEFWRGNANQEILWQTLPAFQDYWVDLFYSTDGGATFPNPIVINTTNDGSYTWSTPLIDLATVRVRIQLKDGSNAVVSSDESAANFTIDSTPPGDFNLLSPANGNWSTGLPNFSWNATTDNFRLGKYELWIDGVVNRDSIAVSATSTPPAAPLSAGFHTWNVKAVDKVGNARQSNQTWSVRIDNEAPAAFSLLTPPDSLWSRWGEETFTWSPSSDNGSGLSNYIFHFGATVNLTTETSFKIPHGYPASGFYKWYIEAKDAVGNIRQSNELRIFFVDNTPPIEFSLISPTSDIWTRDSTPLFMWQAAQDTGSGLSKYELFIDNIKVIDNISPLSISIELDSAKALKAGPHTWYINALDKLGNSRQSAQTYTINIDLQPPALFSLKTPLDSSFVNFPTPDFSWYPSSDNQSGLAYYSLWIDDVLSVDNITGTSSSPSTPLTEGLHVWYVRAADKVGNGRESSQRWHIIGEWNPPEPFDLAFPPNSATVSSGLPAFAWHRTIDLGSGVEKYQLWIDGLLNTDNIPAADSLVIPANPLANGSHYWFVKAKDKAGNERPSLSTWQIIVDRAGNLSPNIQAIAEQTATEDAPFYLKIIATDPNPTDVLRFSDNTDLFDINRFNGEIFFTPTNEDVGEHQVTLIASDGDLSDSTSFVLKVENVNDVPYPFALLYPAHFAIIDILNPALVWHKSVDIDKDDQVLYRVYIDTLSIFSNPTVFDSIADTMFVVPYGLKKSTEYFWKVDAIDLAGTIATCESFFKFITSAIATKVWHQTNGQALESFALLQNYPNPFNPGTDVEYQLPKSAKVTLTIFNLVGQKILVLVEEEKPAGFFTAHWDGSDEQGHQVPSGVYIYRFQAGNFVAVKKMALLH